MVKVSVVKCNSYDDKLVYDAVKKSLELINFKIRKNSSVLLKPNLLGHYKPEEAVDTHPAIVDAVCRILKENNCGIAIGDSSGFFRKGYTKKSFEVSGIADVARKYKADIITFETSGFRKIKNKSNKILDEIVFAKPVFEYDYVINLPKLKTHTLTLYTGAVKNFFGCIPGGLKQRYHLIGSSNEKFSNLLLDIYMNLKPKISLNIMDAVVGIEGQGPSRAGNRKKAGIILASADAVALDIEAARITGFKKDEVLTNKFAVERNIFSDSIEVVGEKNLSINYKKPVKTRGLVPAFIKNFVYVQVQLDPSINMEKCIKCGICSSVCPSKALTMKKGEFPEYNKGLCFHCYCCHEMCPEAAIDLKRAKIIDFISKIKDRLRL